MTQTPRWTAGALLGRAFGLVRGSLEIFILIALLWTILSALVFLPIQGEMQDIMTMAEEMQQSGQPDPQMQQALGEKVLPIMDDILLIAIVTLLFSAAAYLVWARAIALGRGNALGPGAGGRFAMILWRQISLIGYILLIVIVVAIVGLILQVVLGMLGGGPAVVALLSNLLTIALMLPVFVGFAVSVAATAVGDRRGIMACLQAIRGRMAAPLMASGAILIGLIIVVLGVSALMTGLSGGQAMSTPALLVQNALNSMFLLTLIAVGRAIYERIDESAPAGPDPM